MSRGLWGYLVVGLGLICANASAAPVANPIHPVFQVLDDQGANARQSGLPVSVRKTCGACHDIAYIQGHSTPDHGGPDGVDCVKCHFAEGRLPDDPGSYDAQGRLLRDAIRISAPRDENCALCHGIVHVGSDPLRIPDDYDRSAEGKPGERTDAMTRSTGAIYAGQNLSESYLNLQDKTDRAYPWDVHARRLVSCIDCHFARNNPAHASLKQTTLDFLKDDPRRISLAEFLHRPDHTLTSASCQSCHDPLKTHAFLPYRQRHLDLLECQACHAPRMMAPAARMIDATVVRPDGSPSMLYRGVELRDGESLNAAFIHGYVPLLLRSGPSGAIGKLGPYNAVDRWFWTDGNDVPVREVDEEIVRRAYLDGGGYAPSILAAFDADHDGAIGPSELRLDSDAKADLVRSRLRDLGIREPVMRRRIDLNPIRHGVVAGTEVQKDCERCHSSHSRLDATLDLSPFIPRGADPKPIPSIDPSVRVRIEHGPSGDLAMGEGPTASGIYVFGHSRRGWSDRLGFILFLLAVLGAVTHAGFRVFAARHRDGTSHPTTRIYLYSRYERLWHWLMAMSILVLMGTGLQIHFSGGGRAMPLPSVVKLHNVFAVVMIANAFLSLFYHLTTSAILQFLPGRKGLLGRMAEQARFYTRGFFLGHPHPLPKSPERKLNPLQQVTYLALLNVLFPLQVLTGALIWGASRWPSLAGSVGGLGFAAPLHNLGSWLFLAFFVMHLYLTTTGHTVWSNIGAMVDGYDRVEPAPATGGGSHE